MRTTIALLLLCLVFSARAREWRSELYHCTANIPDSGGWQNIEASQMPGIATILVMQHTLRQSVFGISVVEKYRGANLGDVAIQKDLEAMLRQLGYQFVGHSTVKIGGLDWLQYPVRAASGTQQLTGVIRYTSAGGYVFSLTLLRGGGQDLAQDSELQQVAMSFRVLPASAFASAAPPSALARKQAGKTAEPTAPDAGEPAEGGESKFKMIWIWYGVAGLFVLAMFFGIIGTGRAQRR